jgi:hypothetical protein
MQRYIDPNQTTLFRGSERIRLMTMIVMLAVVGQMIFRARDPQTWAWLAVEETVSPAALDAQAKQQAEARRRAAERPRVRQVALTQPAANAEPTAAATAPPASSAAKLADDVPPPDAAPPSLDAAAQPTADAAMPATSAPSTGLADDVPPPEPGLDPAYVLPSTGDGNSPDAANSPGMENPPGSPGQSLTDAKIPAPAEEPPIDEDPIERKEFQFEAGALTDKDSLRAAEMPAYWRLVDWERQQTFEQLDKRGRRDLVFTHLWEHPERYRGQLVRLKLNIRRAIATDADVQGKARDLKRTYEAWGWTDESHNPYVVVLTSLPDNFPLGYSIDENVVFDGYFLKLMRFEAGDGKQHAAPLLIGQLSWRPRTMPPMPFNPAWAGYFVLGGLAVVMLVVRMTFRMRPPRPRAVLPPLRDDEEAVPIETWLERVEENAAPRETPAIEHSANGHVEGNGSVNGSANGASESHPDRPEQDASQGPES